MSDKHKRGLGDAIGVCAPVKYTTYTLVNHTITATETEAPEHDGYLVGVDLAELSRHGEEYAKTLRGYAHALWSGAMDYYQAWQGFSANVRIGLTNAWYRGSKECGIQPADLSPLEQDTLEQAIASESSHIRPFLLWVANNNKASGMPRGKITNRVNGWGIRYDDIYNRSRLLACSDQKFLWDFNALGVTKDPCNSCKNKLAGKVKRASYWHRERVQPQNPPNSMLKCGGWG